MIRRLRLMPCLLVLMPSVGARAAERDILGMAKEHPLKATVDGKRVLYGDPYLDAAERALRSAIPRPWTVPVILPLFEDESAVWLSKLQHQRDIQSHNMWKGSGVEGDRIGYLATILAASRDPRAGLALGHVLENSDFPEMPRVVMGMQSYFLPDPHYKQIPNTGPIAATKLNLIFKHEAQQWWALNQCELKASALSK